MWLATSAATAPLTHSARADAFVVNTFSGLGAAMMTRAPAECAAHISIGSLAHATVVTRVKSIEEPLPPPKP